MKPQILLLEDAVKIALENNYEIKIATNNAKIDATNNNLANAGMMPKLNANFTNNNSQLDTEQTQADGTIRALDNAKNMNLSYDIGLDWTIFDGLSMFARKEQLNILEQQGKTELQAAILSKISAVYLTYFDLVQQQQMMASIKMAVHAGYTFERGMYPIIKSFMYLDGMARTCRPDTKLMEDVRPLIEQFATYKKTIA